MTTFSCCMIVKNESKVLARCLDSIADLMDEIIIVDTGSTDNTKEIAARYTDKIYDFAWTDDFSAARNFSFSKAAMDYIYAPDADEYLDEENHRQLALVKEYMDPAIEIVQMMYHTVSENTVLNITDEYRPKLFKRLRSFTWIDPIHETVRLEPLVFDSDIVITHAPTSGHANRDFAIFKKAILKDGGLSDKVTLMYATELIKNGKQADLQEAKDYFYELYQGHPDENIKIASACVLVREARLAHDKAAMEALLKDYQLTITSEIYLDLGLHNMEEKDYEKAISFLTLAAEEAPYILDVHSCGDLALSALCSCFEALLALESSSENKAYYSSKLASCKKALTQWQPPRESSPLY